MILFLYCGLDALQAMGKINLDPGTIEANKLIKQAVIFYWFGSASGNAVNHNLTSEKS